jgi:hypothetical protein
VFLKNAFALIFAENEHSFTLKMEATVFFETLAMPKKTVKGKKNGKVVPVLS